MAELNKSCANMASESNDGLEILTRLRTLNNLAIQVFLKKYFFIFKIFFSMHQVTTK